ncbi:hypothetical protein C9J03_18780 [Photobacterium gaetbulicola]|uniref:antiviral reverse transcriptase Drt3a n=1 Tax=Photobacterium gaetbulicola TaxID=1295392 RepID=UPI0005CBFA4D|nr:antiviral reverse transcriptase Drt3a [Photobacterium gaetbulicola]PSU04483.1 hypothetical protein C9J03_18780 [Photobacterium gaetbulicola]
MSELAYIPRFFRKKVRYKNLIKIPEFKKKESLELVCNKIPNNISSGVEWNNTIKKIVVKGKPAFTLTTPESILLHNLLVSNIERHYNVKCIDRDTTIRLLISHMKDSYAFSIHRLDIKSFYESFDRKTILSKLKSDSLLSRKTIKIIFDLFQELDLEDVSGLPRGMGISSTISELMMIDFDKFISEQSGVLFYSRFVDDIIIVTVPSINRKSLIELLAHSPLPSKLEFHQNGNKVDFKMIKKTSDNYEFSESFDFLGYNFNVKTIENKIGETLTIDRRIVNVRISENKIEKIKKRIIKSIAKFISSKNAFNERYDLLQKRIYFLSKNYALVNAGNGSQVLSGIFFNYKYVTDVEQLNELDVFYRSVLFSNKSHLSRRLRACLSYKYRLKLSKVSFKEGFENKRFCKLSYKDFKEIKQAWL